LRKAYPILGVVLSLLAILALINSWLPAIGLAVEGVVLMAVRPHPRIAGVCFLASGLLVVATALRVYAYIDDDRALISGSCALASLPLFYAGAATLRSASRDRQKGREGALRLTPVRPAVTVVALLSVVLPSILLAVLWTLTSAFSEGAGVEQSARHVISLWLLGTLLAADGIVLLSVAARPRLAASLLLGGTLTVAGLAVYMGSVVVLLVCSLAALPLLIAGPFAILKPSAAQQ
jgi:hypothetical protein